MVQSSTEQAASGLRSTIHRFDDGDERISVRVTEWSNRTYTAVDTEMFGASPVGCGFSSIGAIADLFEKLPRARSEREERDDLAAKFDHARALRNEGVG